MSAPASVQAPPVRSLRLLPGERDARSARRRLAVAGIALVMAVVLAVGLILLSFSGSLGSYVQVSALIPAGEAVAVGDEVSYLQVQVGTVASTGHLTADGATEVTLHLAPAEVRAIPADVVAQVQPSSLFGTTEVVLSTPHPVAASVAARAVIAPAGGAEGSLQGTLAALDHLLTELHPAQIDATLTALTQAFQGQGAPAHAFVGRLATYVDQMLPQLPQFESDISLLTPVLQGLGQAAPGLLQVAANASATAATVTAEARPLLALLQGGTGVASAATNLLAAVQQSVHAFAANLLPVLGAVNADPNTVVGIMTAATKWASAWSQAETTGPWVDINADYSVADLALYITSAMDVLPPAENQALAQEANADHAALPPNVPEAYYTGAQCARYGTEQAPNCASAPAPPSPPSATLASPAEQAAARQFAAALAADHSAAAAPKAGSGPGRPTPRRPASPSTSSGAAGSSGGTGSSGASGSSGSVSELLLMPLLQSLFPPPGSAAAS